MPLVTIRNLPEATHRALKQRAARHGRSMAAEIRAILEEAVRPSGRMEVGSALVAFGAEMRKLDLMTERDPVPVESADFG